MSIWLLNALIIEGMALLGVVGVAATRRTPIAFAAGFNTMLPVTLVYMFGLHATGARAVLIVLMVLAYLAHMNWLLLAGRRSTALPKLDAEVPLSQRVFLPLLLTNAVGWVYCLPFYFAAKISGPLAAADFVALAVYLVGTVIHFGADYQKHRFKQRPDSRGKLLTTGFWAWCRHPNYFGDFLIYVSFAVLGRNVLGWLAPVVNALQYVFDAIPKNEQWAAKKYGRAWEEYRSRAKAFIPFVY